MKRPPLSRVLLVLGGLLVAIQLVPYGWRHANPPVVAEPKWDSPRTQELFSRACADCHSNQTKWPWYSRVAPVSWLVYNDVQEGRSKLNVSEWNRPQKDAHEAAKEVREGEMPLSAYLLAHPTAQLSPSEKAELVSGLAATFGTKGGGDRADKGEDDDD